MSASSSSLRRTPARVGLGSLAALLSVAALLGWVAGSSFDGPRPGTTPGRAPQAPRVAAAPAPRPSVPESPRWPEREAFMEHARAAKRPEPALEHNAGLPERSPGVPPPPPPWGPDPGVGGDEPSAIDDVEPRGAPASGGALVVIRGRNLDVAQVTFGVTAAQVVSASPAGVVVVAPPGAAGPVTVAITNVDGSSSAAPVPFTYGD